MSTNDISDRLQRAIELVQQGEQPQAERLLLQGIRQAESEVGRNSIDYAQACYEYASLLSYLGRVSDAASALEQAIAVYIPDDVGSTRDRLTYMMTLGELYTDLDRLEDAEKVLRKGLELRGEFYGVEHSGYGFGLEPLASLLMRRGALSEALEVVEQTIDIFWKNGHPRVATAFPLRALILKQMDLANSCFDALEDLPQDLFVELVNNACSRATTDAAAASQAMLDELLHVAESRLEENAQPVLQLRTALVNLGFAIGPSEGQVEAAEKVVKVFLAEKKYPEAIHAMMGLAYVQSNLGNPGESERSYKKAYKLAKDIHDVSLQSQCLRNLGLLYSEQKRSEEADKVLRLAAQAGKNSGDQVLYGRGLVALGIFLQHGGKLDEAQKLLSRALELLPPSEPDGLCGRSHLNAIETGGHCGCGDMAEAMCEAFRLHVLNAVPDGMLEHVRVELEDGDFQLHVHCLRQLSDEEGEMLNNILRQCQVDFRAKLKEKR